MREIHKSGSMSVEGKRNDAERPQSPRPSSTLPLRFCAILRAAGAEMSREETSRCAAF